MNPCIRIGLATAIGFAVSIGLVEAQVGFPSGKLTNAEFQAQSQRAWVMYQYNSERLVKMNQSELNEKVKVSNELKEKMDFMYYAETMMNTQILHAVQGKLGSSYEIKFYTDLNFNEPQVDKDFDKRIRDAKSYTILPPQLSSFLFTQSGYYLMPMVSSLQAKEFERTVSIEFDEAFGEAMRKDGHKISSVSTIAKYQMIRNQVANGTLPIESEETKLKVLKYLDTDLILVPRVIIFGVGTKHASDALSSGVKVDSTFKIQIDSRLQGAYCAIELIAYDRASFSTSDLKMPKPLWRSEIAAYSLGYREPLQFSFAGRVKKSDYSGAWNTLAKHLASQFVSTEKTIARNNYLREGKW